MMHGPWDDPNFEFVEWEPTERDTPYVDPFAMLRPKIERLESELAEQRSRRRVERLAHEQVERVNGRLVCEDCGYIFEGIGVTIELRGRVIAVYCRRCFPQLSAVDIKVSDGKAEETAHFERLGWKLYRTR